MAQLGTPGSEPLPYPCWPALADAAGLRLATRGREALCPMQCPCKLSPMKPRGDGDGGGRCSTCSLFLSMANGTALTQASFAACLWYNCQQRYSIEVFL